MDARWWKPDFSLLGWEVTDKQEEKARMIYMVMAYGRPDLGF